MKAQTVSHNPFRSVLSAPPEGQVGEAQVTQGSLVQDVASIQHHRLVHAGTNTGPIGDTVVLPLGTENQRVTTGGRVVNVAAVVRLWEKDANVGHRGRVVSADLKPMVEQPFDHTK